jgi:hypothetical protein
MSIVWPKPTYVGQLYIGPNGNTWRWNGKAWASLRNIIVVSGPTGSSGPQGPPGAQGATGSNAVSTNVIFYQFSHGPMDPIDTTSYYIGNIFDLPAQSGGSVPSRRVKSLIKGSVNQVSIMTQISGDLGTPEIQEFKLNNFTTGSYSVITSTYSNTESSMLSTYNLSNPLNINEGDELEIIWTTPVFATSPTIIRHYFNVYIEFQI